MFIDRVLDPPSYGYARDGKVYRPSNSEILREFAARLNVFRSRKNWLPLFGWFTSLSFALPLGIFFWHYFSWPLFAAGFIYSMVFLGSHGTFWLHRYTTHRAFKFSNNWARFFCRNLSIKIVPDEIYAISHHVHHHHSEKKGDPYNANNGFLFCFLADVNHQTLNKNLSLKDYEHVCRLLRHTGMQLNSYAQYQKWGSACHPAWTTLHYVLNWLFWYGVFYALGGHALATALFGSAGVWAIGVRTFNFEGHGRGTNKQQVGIDFYRGDLSINQKWPGFVAGEWHNNHHLYPSGARAGFLRYQLDLPWLLIRLLRKLGQVKDVRDNKPDFMKKHYVPYLQSKNGRVREAREGLY